MKTSIFLPERGGDRLVLLFAGKKASLMEGMDRACRKGNK